MGIRTPNVIWLVQNGDYIKWQSDQPAEGGIAYTKIKDKPRSLCHVEANDIGSYFCRHCGRKLLQEGIKND